MQFLRKVALGLAGMAAAYAVKKMTKSIQGQLERAQDANREHEINASGRDGIKTLKLDPKTGVYTTDDT
jgi:hypothetical protein